MAVVANAQPMTMRAFTAGGADEGNSFGVFGQPFASMEVYGNYELTEGVAQMQLERDTVYAVINYEAEYTDNGFDLPSQTKSHKDSVYKVNGADFNYDLLRTLYLIVCPRPDSVKDAGGNGYNTVAVSGYCWTKENLRYETGDQMQYESDQYPTMSEEKLAKYGYLYTWADATAEGTPDDLGYVQGICPSVGWGWHLPNGEEATALMGNEAKTLRSETDWIDTEENTNSTMFTAYPAGEFSAELGRFQGMGTQTDCWTAMSAGNGYATSIQLNYYCSSPMLKTRSQNDGLSVRCVMYNNWKALDEE